jgi:hypothetical protein
MPERSHEDDVQRGVGCQNEAPRGLNCRKPQGKRGAREDEGREADIRPMPLASLGLSSTHEAASKR